ncbi:hypothetical protein BJ875DRAFT_478989 [Amylocarpus encephaloides]|uniref:Uncharacterized protein n=1 Tax=Amylocarpus encephaloides TaxID=45428 RepID=A0A9P7Y4W1_9HELO|nr:hypothetical protein BJ875DRAFT_478989 [Amylocarpus encephaloides]
MQPEMSTQRPFFANFMAAFRAHSALQTGKATTVSTGSASSAQPHSSSSPSQPRTITAASKGATTTGALSALQSPRTHSTSPLSRSPGPSPSLGEPNQTATQPRYVPGRTTRRGSDSSSEGFRDVLGQEKWYIGGRTATGEERYFKLGVIKRQRSVDRLSLDRLSL